MTNNKAKKQNNAGESQSTSMRLMEKRVKKLTTRLWAGLFLLFAMLAVGGLLFANFYYEQLALALTGNYTMTSGDLLTAGDWNTLSADFVDKSGDTMSGDLTAPNVCSASGDCLDNLVSKSGDTMSGDLSVSGNITGSGNVRGSQVCIGGSCRSSWPNLDSYWERPGGAGPFCIFATGCPGGYIDRGPGGYIFLESAGATCPYEIGSVYGSGWTWCHPRICCQS